MVDPHCRIGRVKLKAGGDVHVLRPIETGGKGWPCLEHANRMARTGDMQAVMVAVINKDGKVWHDASYKAGVPWASISGAAHALDDYVMKLWCAP